MMTNKENILACFSGARSASPIFLPDLTLWYDWHHKRATLLQDWQTYTLPQVARSLGLPVWCVAQSKRVMASDARVMTTEQAGERIIRAETTAGTLIARWVLGSDGAWWQTEYPVKTAADLVAVLELVKARSYVFDENLSELEKDVADDGLLVIELPRRPLSDLLHEFLGWGEGLFLLSEAQEQIEAIIAVLEAKLQSFVQTVAGLSGQIILSPDNLDGQFISPRLFSQYLADSYRHTSEVLHQAGKHLVVHIGGPIKPLLAPLAAAGVDVLEGIAGPPQSDASLAEARDIVGPTLTLWGGIAQDYLLETYDQQTFETAVKQAAQLAAADSRMLVGIADRVPVEASLSRLAAIPELMT